MFQGKKVIIFDMDGTLIDSVGIWNQVDCELIRQLGDVEILEDEIQRERDDKLREYSKFPSPYLEYCSYLGDKYQSSMSAKEIHTLRYEIAADFLIHVIDYKPSVERVLYKLKEQGYQLVIATTTRKKNMDIYRLQNENIRAKAPLDAYFSLIYTREDVKEMKPNPEVYLKVLEALEVSPKECLIFEDSLIGVEAANRAGIEVVAMYDKYSENEWGEIQGKATYYYEDYEQIERSIK